MAKFDKSVLEKYGITGTTEVLYNPSYEVLFEEETKDGLTGFDKGQVTELGAVNVMTGIYTGRSPKDKFIVMDETSKDTVWWTSDEYKNDNKPASQEAWAAVKEIAKNELSNKKLYVIDGFCGANKDTRMAVRFIMEVAWQAHFVKNMFIRPSEEELEDFEPDFVVYNASKAKVENYKELGLNSETAVVFNVTSREQVIINTWYGGEMKKGMFSMMNYFLPLKGIASMHCSANCDKNGENTAIFFGLSGTGKTTLSTDPKRLLIGDDEHGWDDNGVFNFEGGCYAKVINLDKESEPDIYNAIRRDALLENVTVDAEGKIDFTDKSTTENTRVSYPIYHIDNIVKPVSHAPAAKQVIFLSADAFGVLPPVSILTPEQTKYYFLSGFTAKLAGTERGITEPTPTFSACFGQAFLEKKADNVKITGQFRASYKDVDGEYSATEGVLRSRLWVNGQVNEDWTYTGMFENKQTYTNDAGDDDVDLARAYVEGRLGGLDVTAGRWNEVTFTGNVLDTNIDGVKVSYGDKVKVFGMAAKGASNDNVEYLLDSEDRLYIAGVEADLGAVNAYAAYFETDSSKVVGGENMDKEIWNVGFNYNFAPDFTLAAEYMRGNEEYYDTDKDGWWADLAWKGASADEPGSYGLHVGYFDQSANAYLTPTTDGFFTGKYNDDGDLLTGTDVLNEGYKGWNVGASYALAKNIVAVVNYYDFEGKENGKDAETIFSELYFTF